MTMEYTKDEQAEHKRKDDIQKELDLISTIERIITKISNKNPSVQDLLFMIRIATIISKKKDIRDAYEHSDPNHEIFK